ncbi:MAG: FAD-dependent oxidoreductase, partial [Clostridiales bacterium]|nr:FAD-dependent oxidoreductase [Clostridiales bacterium]
LAGFASEVHVFGKAASFKAGNITAESGIPVEVAGEARVQKLILQGGKEIAVDGVFVLDHAAPPAALVGGLKTVGERVEVTRALETNIAGLFAAGDLTGRPYQYIKAAGEGNVAAYSAKEYLRTL